MTVETTKEANAQVQHNGAIRAQPIADVKKRKKAIPSLKHGERLTLEEFERRYEAMPELKKAELIEGVVYIMSSPVRYDIHGQPHADIMGWLSLYRVATPGIWLADNTTVRLDAHNEPQPDALLWIDEACGGNSRIIDNGYVEGAPELMVEVAGTSVDYDRHTKLEPYRRNGVKAYIVWQTQEGKLDWFRLVEGAYEPVTPDVNGIIESQTFPGLRLAVEALLKGDLKAVFSELQKGLQTTAHQAFVEELSKKRNRAQ